ncbi:VC2046/SO_2500 family protein [Psychrobium sp. 1_MG-2023]|uniref:VC2046/SO_2500 family protein n=1 Tax=Psychrobium sp. 1_MG-2023 TaxID=3062624 RepID=UPI000C328E2D|nr:VC2046/SO_2500 family protein [Psychrobium sp. 1_MG-2023]MDP2562475.1 VC2046/SO_2500 family protein [Psychrobium sp. 1_MG-2023]PKF54309.1 hypothetical protein CW748_16400 [Alteromonadales bacterium alter-6D02]
MQIGELLVGEIQLGQQLNNSIEQSQQADFALLLSMLSKDVCDQSQFHFKQQDQTETTEQIDLRKQFEMPQPQQLIGEEKDSAQSLSQTKIAAEEGLVAARLSHCIQPEPLCYQLEKIESFERDIFDNLDFVNAAKVLGQSVEPIESAINLNQVIAAQQAYQANLI